jgi:catechol 2,3-dioxygenase-like lactoylglutathione lyase family enzyme
MHEPRFIILYVENPAASAEFYGSLLDRKPVEQSPTFAMFALEGGTMLGLWRHTGVVPPATPVGGSELGFPVADAAAVAAMHDNWARRGIRIIQTPMNMDFGETFVALDPDGHRLRVFAPTEPLPEARAGAGR